MGAGPSASSSLSHISAVQLSGRLELGESLVAGLLFPFPSLFAYLEPLPACTLSACTSVDALCPIHITPCLPCNRLKTPQPSVPSVPDSSGSAPYNFLLSIRPPWRFHRALLTRDPWTVAHVRSASTLRTPQRCPTVPSSARDPCLRAPSRSTSYLRRA